MQDSQSYLKLNTILHLALIAGQVILAIVFVSISENSFLILSFEGDPFVLLVPAVALVGIFASGFMFKKLLEQASSKATLPEKLSTYRAALLIRFALLEAPSLFGLVMYFMNHNLFYMYVSGFIIIYFFTLRPTKEKLEMDLKLDYKQKEEFERGL